MDEYEWVGSGRKTGRMSKDAIKIQNYSNDWVRKQNNFSKPDRVVDWLYVEALTPQCGHIWR